MKKLLALIAVVALLAPAVAECAGDPSQMGRMRGEHDCCPPDEMSEGMIVAAAASASMDVDSTACCERSAEAGQRSALAVSTAGSAQRVASEAMSPVASFAAVVVGMAARLARVNVGPPVDSPPVLSPPLSLRI